MDDMSPPQAPSDTGASPHSWIPANRNSDVVDGALTSATTPSNAGSSEQRSPPAKRRREDRERTRVSRACDRCKKKKTRCTGRCPCTLCLRAGLSCEYTAQYTRGRLPSVMVDEAAMSSASKAGITQPNALPLEDNPLRDLPTFQYAGQGLDASSAHDRPILERVNRPNGHNEDANRDPPSRTSPEPAQAQTDSQGHYVGSSSGVSFLIRIQKRLHQNTPTSLDSSIFAWGDSPLADFDPTFFVLPPKPDAQRLVERYFDYAAPTHRFIHRPTIEKWVHEFYETQGDMHAKEDAAAKTALLLIVFAQAQAYMPPGSTTRENSARYFFAAEHQLSKERGAVRLASVQARLLQCFYLLTQSRINHCWSLFGTTSHLALAIGLNRGRRYDPSATVDYVELESRRRTFWVAYSLDKYLSAALGRPRTFKDEDIDQELPTVVNDSDLHPQYISPSTSKSPSQMMAPVEHIKLTRIVSLVLRDLYPIRPPSLALRIELSAKYTKDLDRWRESLGPFLDAAGIESSLLIPIYQRQRGVLNLAYYHAMLLIHRPFLLSNFANLTGIRSHPSYRAPADTSSNIASCLDAAMNIVRVVDDVFTSSNLFRAFWFTQYYAFCAVVVLYIYRIRQHLLSPGQCEAYFAAGQKCQRQLESISETDCLARRYCVVLEELRLEAARQTNQHNRTGSGITDTSSLAMPGAGAAEHNQANPAVLAVPEATSQNGASPDMTASFYNNGNVPQTPDSTMFNSNYLPSNMADLTSWGQFDSLVTAGIGIFDGGFQGDQNFGFGFNL
ncbi:fungal-specific transcription factor domain-containing protein [Boeremia exigua]|uniref:fungal-specific transcription factor domain-containing protein n=1 Tax=Boeremia exigua TaxID=749465 RepID=UPI001E8CBB60|nr:fungal-specific transcription factor domain-containing protein [Boeremia exigua]KAH6643665.1 fungal-specific transcription factor domain-containing protein [Boeremia exigua]